MNRHMTRTITALAGLIATVVLGTGGGFFGPAAAGAAAPASTYQAMATFTGPITTGTVIEPLSANPLNLAANGYVQQEFFAAGTATAFTADLKPCSSATIEQAPACTSANRNCPSSFETSLRSSMPAQVSDSVTPGTTTGCPSGSGSDTVPETLPAADCAMAPRA